jgi:GST-like protein
MHTLYGSKGSGAAAIEAALILAGVEHRIVQAAEWKPEEIKGLEELKKANPLGQVPTLLLPDGSVLTESAAILIYLGLQFPQSHLLPADPSRRAQAVRGLVYVAANCYVCIGVIDYPERWVDNPDKALRERVITKTRQRLHSLWDQFADVFPATPWLSGDRLGALDLLVAVVSKWSGSRQHLAESRPAFRSLLGRIEAEPLTAAVFAAHWPPK